MIYFLAFTKSIASLFILYVQLHECHDANDFVTSKNHAEKKPLPAWHRGLFLVLKESGGSDFGLKIKWVGNGR